MMLYKKIALDYCTYSTILWPIVKKECIFKVSVLPWMGTEQLYEVKSTVSFSGYSAE